MPRSILFDLDGTLTDSGEGIIKCAIFTLEHYDLPVPSWDELRVFVGPPLWDTFYKFGVPKDKLEEAVAVYRSRYIPIGKFENHPYPGIEKLLADLKAEGHKLYVATSKPEHMAIEILDKFQLSQYFEIIAGAAMDRSRDEKSKVIAYLLEMIGNATDTVMVGDTSFDVEGAAVHKIPTIGVSWGYGAVADMETAGAIAIANTMDELFELLNQ